MIRTIFNIENIVLPFHQNMCQNIVTLPRISIFNIFASKPEYVPKYTDATKALLQGNPYSPRGRPLLSQVTQWCPLGEPRLPYRSKGAL